MQFEQVPILSLKPLPKNARKHSDRNLAVIMKSLAECGQQKPIVVDAGGVVIAGNGTLAAAKKLGWKEIWVARTALDKSRADLFAILDNRSAELAEWDAIELTECLDELEKDGWELKEFGWDDKEREKVRPKVSKEGLTDDDAIPESVETRCKLGDLWSLGSHRLLCGDSTDVEAVGRLMSGAKADMVFTDPPYGVDYGGLGSGVYGTEHRVTGKKTNATAIDSDKNTDVYRDFIPIMALFVNGPAYIFFADTKSLDLVRGLDDAGATIHSQIIWVKAGGYGNLFAQYKQKHEPCLYVSFGNTRWNGPTNENTVWEIERDGSNKIHPTQKPVALAERAILNHTAKTVLDLFLGSGSTLIACEKTNRTCYGCEISPAYCDVILARWEQFTGGTATLVPRASEVSNGE